MILNILRSTFRKTSHGVVGTDANLPRCPFFVFPRLVLRSHFWVSRIWRKTIRIYLACHNIFVTKMLQLFDTHYLLILTAEDTCRIHCCHCCLLPFGFHHHVEAKIESLCLSSIIHSVQEVESVMLAASCWYGCWGLEQPSDRTVVHFLQWPFIDFGIVVVLQGHILLDSLVDSY